MNRNENFTLGCIIFKKVFHCECFALYHFPNNFKETHQFIYNNFMNTLRSYNDRTRKVNNIPGSFKFPFEKNKRKDHK